MTRAMQGEWPRKALIAPCYDSWLRYIRRGDYPMCQSCYCFAYCECGQVQPYRFAAGRCVRCGAHLRTVMGFWLRRRATRARRSGSLPENAPAR